MSIDKQKIIQQIKEHSLVELIYISEEKTYFAVKVRFNGNGKIKDDISYLDYYIQINIPFNFPEILPESFEFSNVKIKKYHHLFTDNTFCIATPIEIRNRLSPNYNISEYIQMVGEYLLVYEYYRKYKVMPVIERSHNETGIFESYQKILTVNSKSAVIGLLESVPVQNKMRNKMCPCGSEKLFKKCHFNLLKKYSSQTSMRCQMKKDLLILKSK